MTRPENPSQSRANEVWTHFVGMFGGDAVQRKYGDAPPPEWVAMIARLSEFEVDRGVRRLVYSGKAHVPSLPEFTRLCRSVGGDDFDEGPQPLALPNPDSWQGDDWDRMANLHLLGYITRQAKKRVYYVGNELTAVLVSYKNAWAGDMREWNGAPTAQDQRQAWEACMARAEAQCELIRVGKAA